MGKIRFWTIRLRWTYVVSCLLLAIAIVTIYNQVKVRVTNGTIEAVSWLLANKVVVVDPGHGGYDGGAVGPTGVQEKDVTLAIGKKLAQNLKRAGAVVVLTRDRDVDLVTPGAPRKKRSDLENRLKVVQKSGAQLYINIQANALGTRWTGAQTFYNPKLPANKELAVSIQAEIKRIMRNTKREALPIHDPWILQNVDVPAAMVEVGFLSNAKEEKLLVDPAYQEKVAFAIYCGIVKFLADQVSR